MPPNITTLVITNREKTELNIDCLYSSTPYMELHFESRLLVPGETIDIDCYFRPHEAMKYKEVIVFEVNGIHRKAVTIKGEGALMKVTVDSLPMCMCVHTQLYMYVHVCILCTCMTMYVCTCMYMYMYMYMCVCMYMYVCM